MSVAFTVSDFIPNERIINTSKKANLTPDTIKGIRGNTSAKKITIISFFRNAFEAIKTKDDRAIKLPEAKVGIVYKNVGELILKETVEDMSYNLAPEDATLLKNVVVKAEMETIIQDMSKKIDTMANQISSIQETMNGIVVPSLRPLVEGAKQVEPEQEVSKVTDPSAPKILEKGMNE